jgi:hypothetical protein
MFSFHFVSLVSILSVEKSCLIGPAVNNFVIRQTTSEPFAAYVPEGPTLHVLSFSFLALLEYTDSKRMSIGILVWVRGFEPPTSCFQGKHSTQTELHPDDYWLGEVDSNHRPADSKSVILPLNYLPKLCFQLHPD